MGSEASKSTDNSEYTSVKTSEIREHQITLSNLQVDYERALRTINQNNNTINVLQLENNNLQKEKLQEQTLKTEMTAKYNNLQKEYEQLKSEVNKYESLPTLKHILDLHNLLSNFHSDVKEFLHDRTTEKDYEDLEVNIQDLKVQNVKLAGKLAQKDYNKIINNSKVQELRQVEIALEMLKNESAEFFSEKQRKLSVIMKELKISAGQLDSIIPNCLLEVEKQQKANHKDLCNMQDMQSQIGKRRRGKYQKILALLQEEKETMSSILNLSLVHNLIETDDDDSLVSGDSKRRYYVIMYNIAERSVDGVDDLKKVEDALCVICQVQPSIIDVQRIGAMGDKPRPIKVQVGTLNSVETILSSKWKLHNSLYKHVRIAPFKPKKLKTDDDDSSVSADSERRYYVIMCNITERSVDGIDDLRKVKDALCVICQVQPSIIDVQRIGAMADKPRPIKVQVGTLNCVKTILSSKWKLHNSLYKHVEIAPFKPKKRKTDDYDSSVSTYRCHGRLIQTD